MAEDDSKKLTHIKLSLEFLSRFDRTRKSEDLTTANLFTLDATEQSTHVVTGLSLFILVRYLQCRIVAWTYAIKFFMEHLCCSRQLESAQNRQR